MRRDDRYYYTLSHFMEIPRRQSPSQSQPTPDRRSLFSREASRRRGNLPKFFPSPASRFSSLVEPQNGGTFFREITLTLQGKRKCYYSYPLKYPCLESRWKPPKLSPPPPPRRRAAVPIVRCARISTPTAPWADRPYPGSGEVPGISNLPERFNSHSTTTVLAAPSNTFLAHRRGPTVRLLLATPASRAAKLKTLFTMPNAFAPRETRYFPVPANKALLRRPIGNAYAHRQVSRRPGVTVRPAQESLAYAPVPSNRGLI